jgi:hypothetical protein
MITQNQVKELFDYRDGELYWKVKPNRKIKIGNAVGTLNLDGYLRTKINGKPYLVHRLIFLWHHGYLPTKVDHENTNRLDSRVENLRSAIGAQNNWNAKKPNTNTSGIKGVSWYKAGQKWRVQLCVEGKKKFFGYYHDIQIAKFIAETMRYKYHKEFANHG